MRVSILLAGGSRGVEELADRAVRGVEAAQGQAHLLRVTRETADWAVEGVLAGDALLIAAPVVLHGLPGELKSFLDSWLSLLPGGGLIPRTSRMRAGYATLYTPDDESVLDAFHRQLRGIFSFLGMSYVGRAAASAAAGGPAPQATLAAAERLGSVLAGAEGKAGWPEGYAEGAKLFNAGHFYEAHEAWEEVWVEEAEPLRNFYQGLIQVAAALHHHGNENWRGMASLLREGREKLLRYRPSTMGLDVDDFLEALEPWRLLAEARCGRAEPVTRIPERYPRIDLGE